MNKPEKQKIQINFCVWLDPGELKKIQHFIFDGGLERAQDKKIENLQINTKGLESKVAQVAFTQKIDPFLECQEVVLFWDSVRL